MNSAASTESNEMDHHDDHPSFLAHHFETPQQQFDSGKLGMWLFLITEILFFSGLFAAYAIYRSLHPEIFIFGHQFLDTNLGAFNTVVLIVSSLTMAWAVRAAQLNQQKLLIGMLTATLAFAGLFLVIKAFEYKEKFDHGLLPGKYNKYYQQQMGLTDPTATSETGATKQNSSNETSHASDEDHHYEHESKDHQDDHSHDHEAGHHKVVGPVPEGAHVFFSIYFCMTGLHAVHIIAGMIAIGWILWRSCKGHFNSEYFGPVDYVGLYWHLVDLVWIYLFPLLYLIH